VLSTQISFVSGHVLLQSDIFSPNLAVHSRKLGRFPSFGSLMHNLLGAFTDHFYPFKAFIIQSYGSVLSPLPGQTRSYEDSSNLEDLDQGNLSRALGSVVGIATLRAETGVVPQLTSHVFGLLKARDIAGLCEEDKWLASDEGTEWVIRLVDEVLDGVSGNDLDQRNPKSKL